MQASGIVNCDCYIFIASKTSRGYILYLIYSDLLRNFLVHEQTHRLGSFWVVSLPTSSCEQKNYLNHSNLFNYSRVIKRHKALCAFDTFVMSSYVGMKSRVIKLAVER